MDNSINLLVKLGINETTSKTGLNAEIDALAAKLNRLPLTLKFDEKSAKAIEQLAGVDLNKLTSSVKKAEEALKGLGTAGGGIAPSLGRSLSDIGKQNEVIFKNMSGNFRELMKNGVSTTKELERAFKGYGATLTTISEKGIDKDGKEVTKIKAISAEYKNLQGNIEKVKFKLESFIDDSSMKKGSLLPRWVADDDIKTINKAGTEVANFTKRATVELNKLHTEGKLTTKQFNEMSTAMSKVGDESGISRYNQRLHEVKLGQTEVIKKTKEQETTEKTLQQAREKTIAQLERMSASGKLTGAQSTSFTNEAQGAKSIEQMDKLRQSVALTAIEQGKLTTETTRQSTAMQNFGNRIQDLVISQKMSTQEAEKWLNKYNSSTPSQRMAELNRQLTVHLNTQKQVNKEEKEVAAVKERIRKLTNDITAAQGRNPKAFANNPEITGMLNSLTQIDPKSKTAASSVKKVSDSFDTMKSKATEAGRSSMGVIESFKIAMEKFPVWMAASTAFYGVIRTGKEFMSIIIDVDTKMTEIKKVLADDEDFGAVFNRATESAERFGQSISQVMDSYIEFAKQGYKGFELGGLADSATVASNVGDISAQKASEYMTAALVQWKMESSESLKLVDSWNEISNNYATTVDKLASGHARSASAARAMGLEFDQVNAIIGTVSNVAVLKSDNIGEG